MGAGLRTREERPGASDPTERPWPWSQAVTNSSTLLRLIIQEWRRRALRSLLAAARPPLSAALIDELEELCEYRQLPRGTPLLFRGQPADALHLLLRGEVALYAPDALAAATAISVHAAAHRHPQRRRAF